MPTHSDLGIRMKSFYESIPQIKLMKRTPVAIRLDGKAFHTFTRNFQKPFDEVLIQTMQETTKYLCEKIQGCVFGYTQSDEITLILIDYAKLNSCAWFDYEVQKLCSISASMATLAFNSKFKKSSAEWAINFSSKKDTDPEKYYTQLKIYNDAYDKAMFDARCFNIPKEEVTNLIYWRQLDATRNSIQMLGRAYFSHRELNKLSCNDIQNKLFTEKNINWNDLPTVLKRGSACIKDEEGHWFIDKEMPILKRTEDIDYRFYVDKLIFIGE